MLTSLLYSVVQLCILGGARILGEAGRLASGIIGGKFPILCACAIVRKMVADCFSVLCLASQLLVLVSLLCGAAMAGDAPATQAAALEVGPHAIRLTRDSDSGSCPYTYSCDDCLSASTSCYFCPNQPGSVGTRCHHMDSYKDVFSGGLACDDGLNYNLWTCNVSFEALIIIASACLGVVLLLCLLCCVVCCCCFVMAGGGRGGRGRGRGRGRELLLKSRVQDEIEGEDDYDVYKAVS